MGKSEAFSTYTKGKENLCQNQNAKVVARLLWIWDKQGLLVPWKVTRTVVTQTEIQSSGSKAFGAERERDRLSVCHLWDLFEQHPVWFCVTHTCLCSLRSYITASQLLKKIPIQGHDEHFSLGKTGRWPPYSLLSLLSLGITFWWEMPLFV